MGTLYLDWSGDAGFNFRRHASLYLVVAAVACESPSTFLEMTEAVRQQMWLAPEFEFRFSRTSGQVRAAYFSALAALSFSAHILVADKTRLPRSYQRILIQQLIAELIGSMPRQLVDGAHIIFDGQRAEVKVIRKIRVAISQRLRQSGSHSFPRKVTACPSREAPGLQVADMLAGAATTQRGRALLQKLRGKVIVMNYEAVK